MTVNSPNRTRGRGRGRSSDYSPDERDRLLNGRSDSDVLIVNDVDFTADMDGEEGVRKRRRTDAIRYTSFGCAILSCLCAGSITAYSLYGHLFLTRLHYTQLEVNAISSAAELAMYLPVPLMGYMVDRYTPRPASLLSSILFGGGYLVAALTYRSGPPVSAGGTGWPFAVMVLAFVAIGTGTTAMYISAVTTCAKNFGRGRHKGFALATPIAAFGLSGLWQSQVGSRILYEPTDEGTRGEVDVFKYFLFLAIALSVVGVIGGVGLQVVNEEELIDDAVDELERSGVLEESAFFRPLDRSQSRDYGSLGERRGSSLTRDAEEWKSREEEERRKKTWLLNGETRRFLGDHTMWWLAAGFFLVTGPGEAFINNLGTILPSLSPPPSSLPSTPPTSAATHISLVALSSTLARILTGTLSDYLAPTPSSPSLSPPKRGTTVSRLSFLLASTLLFLAGQLLLALAYPQRHPTRFIPVSLLIGAGYGAIFSLVPIIISVVWGVENFGTNWGVVAVVPAVGASVWGAVYGAVYQRGIDGDGGVCYGSRCYSSTFYGMAGCSVVAAGCWAWAWRGPRGWKARGIAV